MFTQWHYDRAVVSRVLAQIDLERRGASDPHRVDPRPYIVTRFADETLRDVLGYVEPRLLGLSAVQRQRLRAKWAGEPNASGITIYVE